MRYGQMIMVHILFFKIELLQFLLLLLVISSIDCTYYVNTFQQLKRKNEAADFEADSGDRMNPGSTEAAISPFQTPLSGKMGKGGKSSRLTKCNKSATQTPGPNIGEYYLTKLFQ